MKEFPFIRMSLVVYLLLVMVSSALAQAPPAAPPAPVVVDTALVEIILPENSPDCLSIVVPQDTLGFGLAGLITLVFAESVPLPVVEDLKTSDTWLQISKKAEPSEPNQLILNIYAYRFNPFQIKVGDVEGPVVQVKGATSDLSETATIRMPGVWATRWWILLLPALLLTVLTMGLWWLWQRRMRLAPLDQWAPAAPAWLKASIDLRKLLEGSVPDLDNSRQFLDQLSSICRGYLANRYLIHAGEMTSGEILTHCQLKGHDNRSLRHMVKILQELDHNRYDPEPPAVSWCLDQAGDLLGTINEVRILPRYTFVEADLLVEAESAWTWLNLPENRNPHSPAMAGGEK